jgi:integrase/recombinase XerC
LTHGDVRAVMRYSRHQDMKTVSIYDDNRKDLAGEVARLVAQGKQRTR